MTEHDWERYDKLVRLIFDGTPPGFGDAESRLLALKIMRALNL